jgi:flavodoxin
MPTKKPLRKLVIYYSNTGATRHLAQAIASSAGADLVEIKTLKPLPSFKLWLLFLGGLQASIKVKPAIQPLTKNPENYDLIFIGTPIWAGRFVPALRTCLAKVGLKGKRVALFASGDSGKPGRAFIDIRAALPDNSFSADFIVKDPLLDKTASARLARDWARQVLKG